MGAALSCFQVSDGDDGQEHRQEVAQSPSLCIDLVVARILDVEGVVFESPVQKQSPIMRKSGGDERTMCTALFQGARPTSHSQHAVVPEQIVDDSSCNTYRPPPRPLPFDDPRCSYMPPISLVSSFNKASSHLLEDQLDINNDESDVESFGVGDKCKSYDSLPSKQAPRESEYGLLYAFSLPEEDSCPICLEEYCGENPKIILKCTHHFHLSCLYEWMERSEACPLCGKGMEFEEKT